MIRTRIAPSPTGESLHVGTVATALVNYAWAKKNNGKFIIRIEDTDRSRIVEGGEQKMLETLDRIGLIADESPVTGGLYGPYRQSERLDIYKKYVEELVKGNKAYYCTCTPERLDQMRKEQQGKKQVPKYDRKCLHNQKEVLREIKEKHTPFVVRLLVPEGKTEFEDTVRGKIIFDNSNIDDQIILKSDGFPTYHLGVVVDDHLMEITHVIRGEEWLPSTPKHVMIYRALNWKEPVFTHLSLLRNPDRSKLSKRKNPVWTSWFLDKGILPEALLNYVALMGWSHPQGKEIFSLKEYVDAFDLKDINRSAPVFDPVKLDWLNGEYIRKMSDKDLGEKISAYIGDGYPKELVSKTVPLIKERIKKLSDYILLSGFFFQEPVIEEHDFKVDFSRVCDAVSKIENWSAKTVGEVLQKEALKQGIKNAVFFMEIRIAITGNKVSPPLNESMEILGKETCLRRLTQMKKSL